MSRMTDIEATVTGVVWRIDAPAGTRLSEGDPVVMVESMKMEIPITATEDGEVAEVLVAVDDLVEEGQVIARMRT